VLLSVDKYMTRQSPELSAMSAMLGMPLLASQGLVVVVTAELGGTDAGGWLVATTAVVVVACVVGGGAVAALEHPTNASTRGSANRTFLIQTV
jgi:hypothetical protein